MRRKVSTLLDEGVFVRTKLEAARSRRQISEVIGEALVRYLDERRVPQAAGGVAASSWGALALDGDEVRRIMEEEDGLFDA